MNKLKSPLYLWFLMGGCFALLGLILMILGGSWYGARDGLTHVGGMIINIGIAICWLPAIAAMVLQLRDRWKNGR